MRIKPYATLGLAAIAFAACLTLVRADDAPAAANPATAAAPSAEELSLRGFGDQNPQCLEWTDSCAICLRDEKNVVHCSTPGIACQQQAIVCRTEKAK